MNPLGRGSRWSLLVGRGSRNAKRLSQSSLREHQPIDPQGRYVRRAVAHDRPRLGAFNGV